MAQVYKMMLGTSGRQWELLTVKDDGTMMLYFHGTDRSVTTQVTAIEDGEWKGWLKSEKGSMWPGIESGRWKLVSGAEADNEQRTVTDDSSVVSDFVADCHADEEKQRTTTDETEVQMQAPCAERFSREEIQQPKHTPRPRRQRKPRKPVVEHQPSAISHQPSKSDNGWLRSMGYLAAASVALLVIWQTGLIIPLGLIGLATSGIIK